MAKSLPSTAEGSPVNDPFFNEAEAAAMLSLEPATLRTWRSTKRYALPFCKLGRAVRYRKSAIEAFIRSNTVGPSAE